MRLQLPPIKTATVIAAQSNKIPIEAQIHVLLRDDLGLSARVSSVTYNFSLLK